MAMCGTAVTVTAVNGQAGYGIIDENNCVIAGVFVTGDAAKDLALARIFNASFDMLAALKGARDAIDAIPEGIRGVHDSLLNRQLRRIDEAIARASGQQV